MSNSVETNTAKGSKNMASANVKNSNKTNSANNNKKVVQGTDIQEIEKSLDKTSLGHFVNENKNAILIAGVVVVLLAMGYSFIESKRNSEHKEVTQKIYEFEKNYVKTYFTQKTEVETKVANKTSTTEDKSKIKVSFDDVMVNFGKLSPELKNHRSMLPINLKLMNELVENNRTAEAIKIGNDFYQTNLGTNEETYLMGLRLAVLLENENKVDDAIKVLEKLNGMPLKWMQAKNYLDLGRLYLKKQDTNKAKANFDFLIKKYPKDEMAKLAKIYLNNISSEK